MPVYEYKCEHCGKKFEVLVMNVEKRDTIQPCPICGSERTKRLVSQIAGFSIDWYPRWTHKGKT